MKCLRRNMTEFEYLPYLGTETDLNESGEHTGEFYPEYGAAVPYMGNISTPSGQTNQTFYGEDIRYTHTLVMGDPNVDIRENGVIRWNDAFYDIIAVRRSPNTVSIAIRKQTVNMATEEQSGGTVPDENTPQEGSEEQSGGSAPSENVPSGDSGEQSGGSTPGEVPGDGE